MEKYTITTNKDGFVLSISHTANDDIELNLEDLDLEYLEAYKLADNALWLDEARKTEIMAEREAEAKAQHIAELKEFLNDTDYVVAETFEKVMSLNNAVTFIADFIKIMIEFKTKYSTILTERATARQIIEDNTETK